jgi:hypothetical protein
MEATRRAQVAQARQILRKTLDGPVILTPTDDGVRLEGQARPTGRCWTGSYPVH